MPASEMEGGTALILLNETGSCNVSPKNTTCTRLVCCAFVFAEVNKAKQKKDNIVKAAFIFSGSH